MPFGLLNYCHCVLAIVKSEAVLGIIFIPCLVFFPGGGVTNFLLRSRCCLFALRHRTDG